MRHLLSATVLAVLLAACGTSVATPALRTATLPGPTTSSSAAPTVGATIAAPGEGSMGTGSSAPPAAETPTITLPTLALPSIAVPAAALRTMATDGGTVTWGSRAYGVDEPVIGGRASVVTTDLVTGKRWRAAIPFLAGETTQPPDGFWDPATVLATNGHWLAVVVWRRLGSTGGPGGVPCSGREGQPIAWRLLVAPLEPAAGTPSGAFRVLDQGTNRHEFLLPGQGEGCAGPRTPRVAISVGQIAYTVEDPGPGDASGIELRSLPAGALVREIPRADEVLFVALSGKTLAFTESQDGLGAGANPHWDVAEVTSAHPDPVTVVVGTMNPGYVAPPVIALDGDLLAWQLLNRQGQGVWVEGAGSAPLQIVPSGLTCWLGGVSAGWVGLGCVPTGYQTSSYLPIQPVLWSAATGFRQLTNVPRLVLNTAPALGGGWLSADGGTDIGPSGTFYGLPLASLPTSP